MSETSPTTSETPQQGSAEPDNAATAQPRYAPPQYVQPPQTQQFSQQQQPHMPPHQQFPQPRQFGAPGAPQGRVNVLGIVALAIVALSVLANMFVPFLYRVSADIGSIGATMSAITTVQAVLHVVAGGLAIAGVLQKNAPRFRWAAIGALVSCALWLVSSLGSLFTGWISSVMY